MNSFVYIPINNNSKISAVPWKNVKSTHPRCAKYNNRAILTGQLSNIVVVDIDDLSVWAEYLKTNRTPVFHLKACIFTLNIIHHWRNHL